MFLEINNVQITKALNDSVYELVIDVAATDRAVESIAEGLRQLLL